MKSNVRDLRYRFREIEARLNRGEEVDLYKRKKLIGKILPVKPAAEAYPDFAALRGKTFGKKKTRTTGTRLMAEERGKD